MGSPVRECAQLYYIESCLWLIRAQRGRRKRPGIGPSVIDWPVITNWTNVPSYQSYRHFNTLHYQFDQRAIGINTSTIRVGNVIGTSHTQFKDFPCNEESSSDDEKIFTRKC